MTQTSHTPEKDTRPVAFFDFDGTLTTGDTLMPFLRYVVGGPTYYAKLVLLSPVLAAYFAKSLRNDIAKQIVLKQYLSGYHVGELFEVGKWFSEDVIPALLRPAGMERLRWHQEQGHECVLVSASLDVYLNAWAKAEYLSSVICTSLQRSEDEGFVKIKGKNCHGEEKIRRIFEEGFNLNLRPSYAYGDTKGDLPMLNIVDEGFLLKGDVFISVSDEGF